MKWLPDWRSAAGYPDPDLPNGTMSAYSWKWEFLRRNSEYQNDYRKFSTDSAAEFWLRKYQLPFPHDPANEVPPTFVRYRPFFKGPRRIDGFLLSEREALVYFDLEEREATIDSQWQSIRLHLIDWFTTSQYVVRKGPRGNVVEVGAEPTDPPHAPRHRKGPHALRHRKGYQWRPEQWLKYLRILDAHQCQAEDSEIFKVLYADVDVTLSKQQKRKLSEHKPSARKLLKRSLLERNLSKRVDDDWKAAIELRDVGYCRIW